MVPLPAAPAEQAQQRVRGSQVRVSLMPTTHELGGQQQLQERLGRVGRREWLQRLGQLGRLRGKECSPCS